MKKTLLGLLVFVMIFAAAGCYRADSVSGSGFYAPYRILDADVPFAGNLHTAQFDRVERLEADRLGRQYFRYTTFSANPWCEIEAHVICQKADDTSFFYYPDDCYLIRATKSEDFSGAAIAAFKARNDWDLPLEDEKMYQISASWYRNIINQNDMESLLRAYFELSEDDHVLFNGLEIQDGERQLFYVHISYGAEDQNSEEVEKNYLLVYDCNEPQPIVAVEEVPVTLECQDLVREFRSNWFEARKRSVMDTLSSRHCFRCVRCQSVDRTKVVCRSRSMRHAVRKE